MKRFTKLSIMLAAILSAASCSEKIMDRGSGTCGTVPISLSVKAVGSNSRSIITATTLGDGAEIGICLTGNDGTYDGNLYSNVRFTADDSSSDQTWTPDSDVMVSSSLATLHAYYPYSDDVTDLGSIPLETASQTDYLYALPAEGINNRNADVTISMQHALAAVKFNIRRGSYTGPGSITGISAQGDNMATEGILNAISGEITDLGGKGDAISLTLNSTNLENTGTEIYMLAIPTGRNTGMNIDLRMDGESFSIDTDPVTLSQGTIADIDITINNSSVTVSPVRIKKWEDGSAACAEFSKNWTVNLSGETEGIIFTHKMDEDGSLRITAAPEYSDAEVNPIKGVSGDASITEYSDPDNGSRTIILSDINSDIDLEFDSWCLWVTATYEVTDIGSTTRLLYHDGSPDRTQCTRMKVDGTEVPPANIYMFDTAGEHTVKFTFPDKALIPESCFTDNPGLKSIVIPEGVRKLSTYAFYNCEALESVTLPKSLESAGYDVFSYCIALRAITFPDNLVMSYSLLRNCTGLEEVTLPKNLTNLPSSTFSGCTSLKQVDIPQSVKTIESRAFESSGIVTLTIPSGVTFIPDNMCYGCKSLETIHLPESLTEIDDRAFMSCNSLNSVHFGDSTPSPGELDIAEGIRKVGEIAFNGCDMLTSLSVPSTLTEIGNAAFTGKNIATVTVSSGNPVYEKRGDFNGIVEKATDALIFGCANATVVPSSVTQIGDYAYYNMPINNIDLHEDITYIGNYAFYKTNTLKKIISRAEVPPALGTDGVFRNPATWGYIYVPQKVASAYQTAWLSNTSTNFLKYYNWRIKYIENI